MVWGDFEASKNVTVGKALLRYQKKLVGMITGQKGTFHSDPLFAELGILKIEHLYTDHCSIAYRVPKEWEMLPERLREVKSLSGFKRQSKMGFTSQYKEFKCYQGEYQVCKGDRRGLGFPRKVDRRRVGMLFRRLNLSGINERKKTDYFYLSDLSCVIPIAYFKVVSHHFLALFC